MKVTLACRVEDNRMIPVDFYYEGYDWNHCIHGAPLDDSCDYCKEYIEKHPKLKTE